MRYLPCPCKGLDPSKELAAKQVKFSVATVGKNRLGLAELCERFTNEQWLPDHIVARTTGFSWRGGAR